MVFMWLFFKNSLETIGGTVCDFVINCFHDPSKIQSVNDTILVLIPKVDSPENVKQLRPISLYNVIFKIIMKIIASRLKHYMDFLVNYTQKSFVGGRSSTDNIIIAQEVLHFMERKKGTKGHMAIKVDLEKAYDRVNWVFLEDTLYQIGLSHHFVSVIMHCVTTANMRIMWNGSLSDSFKMEIGIRHGDPLSPYLFVLCMERLGHVI